MSPPPKKKNKEDETEAVEPDLTEIPVLPDDLIMMIFDELTTEEREPIGTTCKRFRELDFEIGNKTFDTIIVNCKFPQRNTSACIHRKTTTYKIGGLNSALTQATYSEMRLFRRAKAKHLIIKQIGWQNARVYRSITERNISILKSIPFDKLQLTLDWTPSCIELYMSSFIENRNLQKAGVFLQFYPNIHYDPIDGEQARTMLMRLPKMDKFKLECAIVLLRRSGINPSPIIDDRTLLHIISNTNHSEINCLSDCSAQGICDAFQMVCDSKGYKYYLFVVPESSVELFFASFNFTTGIMDDGSRYAYDRNDRSILWAHNQNLTGQHNFWSIQAGKMDDDLKLIREEVIWN